MSRTRRPEGPLTPVLRAYREARGRGEDQAWAEQVVLTLAREEVSPQPIVDELRDALPLVRETGEGPAELYGPAREWAAERVADRAERGLATVDSTPDARWRDVPVVGSVAACLVSLLMMLVWLLRDGLTVELTWGLLLLPLLAGTGVVAALATWESVLTRRRAGVAAAAGLGVAAAVVAGLAWLLLGTRDAVLATTSTFALALLAVGYALLAGLLERVLPQAGRRDTAAPDDEVWSRELAGTLRLRLDLSEARVTEIVREARAHAARSGAGLREEFGTPASYASRFSRDRVARARRAAWGWTALVPVVVLLTVDRLVSGGGGDPVSWFWVLLTVAVCWSVATAWRRARRERGRPQAA
ncbi:hypothetical protein [uncultured Serinicoccus sp.]|uniref:hypothetical protein n=1 Tax=uncultured Serinicoccus sp. TaxID=735514 RepID=UPI00262A2291|nr:hypothetical protein [uncultured Serinicoccus sp.]